MVLRLPLAVTGLATRPFNNLTTANATNRWMSTLIHHNLSLPSALKSSTACRPNYERGWSMWRPFCSTPIKEIEEQGIGMKSVGGPVLAWSEDEVMLRGTVQKFAHQNIKPLVSEMDEKAKLDKTLLAQLFEAGFMGIEVAGKYGGSEMTFTQTCIVIEELAKIDPAISVIVDIHNTLNNHILSKYGSEFQKERYLYRMATQSLSSFCLSEPSAGSDAFALKTVAVPSHDKKTYTLKGTKMWISNAAEADIFLVFANVNPTLGYKGITAFIVDRNSPGLSIGKKENKLGIRASSCCEVVLDNVQVDAHAILGKEGMGYKIAIESLNEGRIGIGAQMIGLAQGALNATMPYLFERKQFGHPVATFQGMQFQIAQAHTELEAAKLLVYNAARMKDAGMDVQLQAAYAKLYSSQIAEKIASKCIEWSGGVGFTKEFPMEKFFRDVKIGQIYEGTSNMQLQTIGRLLSREFK
mmetsp:Transcript_16116/g.28233  ORF Transcript_16116/g.28233 Transcript_16116/m.28233 type:complete len:468 (+) Transcript_16116:153-1556(+)